MEDSGKFSRYYESKNGVGFTYEVQWQRNWRTVYWTARVHAVSGSQTVLKAATADVGPADDPTTRVSADVEQHIERLVGVSRTDPGTPLNDNRFS
jgi:hypothetical protein